MKYYVHIYQVRDGSNEEETIHEIELTEYQVDNIIRIVEEMEWENCEEE